MKYILTYSVLHVFNGLVDWKVDQNVSTYETFCMLMGCGRLFERVITVVATDFQGALVFPNLLFCRVRNDGL